jgi:hypothetical protein
MTDLLEHHLAATANPLDDSDWLAVVRRARRPRRRMVLIAAAVIAAALATAPAFAVFDLLSGPPAPPAVQKLFADNNAILERLLAEAPSATKAIRDRMLPGPVGEARGVAAIESSDGPIYLWAAPLLDREGQCWLIQAGGDPVTSRPYGTGSCDGPGPSTGIATDSGWTDQRPDVLILHVRVYDDAITHVEVDLRGADPVYLPVASGHALGTVPKGAVVEGYVGLNANGDAVATELLRH